MSFSTSYIVSFVIGIIGYILLTYYLEMWNRAIENAAIDERNKKTRAYIKNARAMREPLKDLEQKKRAHKFF